MRTFSFLPALSVALVAGSAGLLRAQVQTESFISNDFRFAEFDSRALPAGLYYCRAAGSGWSATTGVIVESGAR